MCTQSSAIFKSEELPMQIIIIPSNRPQWYGKPVIHHWICSRNFVNECVPGLQVAIEKPPDCLEGCEYTRTPSLD
jgi:hypothetical protein